MFFRCRLIERKRFFYANYFNWPLTSPVIIDMHPAVEPSWSRNLTESWSSMCSLVFPWILEVNACKEEKKSLSVFVLDSKTKEDDKIVLRRVGFEISRERQGFQLQSRKMAKSWQSFWKTHWNYRGIEFHEFFSERSELFRPRKGQASDEVARGPAPSLTNSRGSRVAGPKSRSRVQCRGRGKWFGVRGNSWVKTTDMNTI